MFCCVSPGESWTEAAAARLRRVRPARCLVFASWAALEIEEGRFDETALDALRRALMTVAALDAEPVLCLYAGEDPAWFTAKGGWEKEDNIRCYLRYAGRTVRAVGHLAAEYVTFYAPNELVWRPGERRGVRRSFLLLSHMACDHVRAVKLIRDTRQQRGLEDTAVGFVLRAAPALSLRRGLLTGKNRSTASGYQKLPALAMARGEFVPPMRNALRVRPGDWSDFLGLVCDREHRQRCRAELGELIDLPLRTVWGPEEDDHGDA